MGDFVRALFEVFIVGEAAAGTVPAPETVGAGLGAGRGAAAQAAEEAARVRSRERRMVWETSNFMVMDSFFI